MPLNDLSLSDLRQLSDRLTSIVVAGFRLEQDGLAPRFDLTPGMPIRITLGAVMPVETRPDFGAWLTSQATEPTEAAPMPKVPEPVDAAPVDLLGPPGAAPISAEPSRSDEAATAPEGAVLDEVPAESGGGEEVAAPEVPAAPVPGSASAMAAQAGLWAGEWTQVQDQRLIGDLVAARLQGKSKSPVFEALARDFGRTPKAVELRSYRLKAKVNAALATATMVQAQTETPAIPEAAKSGPGQGDAAVGGHSPAAVQADGPTAEVLAAAFARPMNDAPSDLYGKDLELWRYLQSHRPRWPHTVGTDLDLVIGLSRGDKLPMVSADLGIDTEKLKERFQTLTRPIQDAKGHITIDGGPRLITLLRRIVKAPAEAA